jgi:uncharacterized small protein (DUF1192 family)
MRETLSTSLFRGLALLMVAAVFSVGLASNANAALLAAPDAPQAVSQERAEGMDTIRQALESKVVAERLKDLGLSQQEIDQRLAMLSDQEISRLAADVQNVDTAGSALGIIAGVAIVALIVFGILELTGHADNF